MTRPGPSAATAHEDEAATELLCRSPPFIGIDVGDPWQRVVAEPLAEHVLHLPQERLGVAERLVAALEIMRASPKISKTVYSFVIVIRSTTLSGTFRSFNAPLFAFNVEKPATSSPSPLESM